MRFLSAHSFPFFFAAILLAAYGSSFAQSDSTSQKQPTAHKEADSAKFFYKKHPWGIGLIYEFADLKAKNLSEEMTKDGKRYNLDVDVSNMLGINGQYSLNEWISLFGLLGFQKFTLDCEPRDKSEKEDRINAYNAFIQMGVEVGFSFLHARNYQLRALGFFGGTVGFTHLDDSYYNDTPLFGYVRGIGLQFNIHQFGILAGFRSTHIYFHTYNNDHWKDDDHSLMIDFDTMSSPFVSFCIGF